MTPASACLVFPGYRIGRCVALKQKVPWAVCSSTTLEACWPSKTQAL